MERTMYEEQTPNDQTPLPYAINLKQSFILDFNSVKSRQPMDMGIIKLGSPDLERLLVQQDGSVVTALTPTTQILFPKSVTEEQEAYARGFIDALDELHRRQGRPLNNGNNPSSLISLDKENEVENKNIVLLNNNTNENGFTTLTTETTTIPQCTTKPDDNDEVINNYSLITSPNSRLSSDESPSRTHSSLPPAQTLLSRLSTIQQQQQKQNIFRQEQSLQQQLQQQHSLDLSTAMAIHNNLCNNVTKTSIQQPPPPPPPQQRQQPPSSSSSSSLSTATTSTTTVINNNIAATNTANDNFNVNININNILSLDPKDLSQHSNLKALFSNNAALFNLYSNNNNHATNMTITDDNALQTVPRILSSPPQSISSAASLSGDSPSPASISNCDDFDRLEMKRARNRLAAQKCRSRKLERIAVLSQRVEELKEQNAKLERVKMEAARRVEELREVLMSHANCGSGAELGDQDMDIGGMVKIDLKT